jgi:hypothetical protein
MDLFRRTYRSKRDSEAELFRSPKIISALDGVFCSALESRGRHPANPAGLWFSMMLPVLDQRFTGILLLTKTSGSAAHKAASARTVPSALGYIFRGLVQRVSNFRTRGQLLHRLRREPRFPAAVILGLKRFRS